MRSRFVVFVFVVAVLSLASPVWAQAKAYTSVRSDKDVAKALAKSTAYSLSIGGSVSPAGLKKLQGLKGLKRLYLYEKAMSGATAVSYAAGFPDLEELIVHGATDADARQIAEKLPAVTRLYLHKSRVTDKGLEALSEKRGITRFYLETRADLTEMGLRAIGALPELTNFEFPGCGISDQDLREMGTLGSPIDKINLSGNSVTDSGLAAFRKLTTLRSVNLSGTGVTGAGLRHLAASEGITFLDLSGVKVRPKDLEVLKRWTRLSSLSLNGSGLTDEGLVHLTYSKRYSGLMLGDTQVTDKVFEVVKGCAQIRNLYLKGTGVTEDGVEAFEKANPRCRVTF